MPRRGGRRAGIDPGATTTASTSSLAPRRCSSTPAVRAASATSGSRSAATSPTRFARSCCERGGTARPSPASTCRSATSSASATALTTNFASLPLQMSPQDGRGFSVLVPDAIRDRRARITALSECSDAEVKLYFYVDWEAVRRAARGPRPVPRPVAAREPDRRRRRVRLTPTTSSSRRARTAPARATT